MSFINAYSTQGDIYVPAGQELAVGTYFGGPAYVYAKTDDPNIVSSEYLYQVVTTTFNSGTLTDATIFRIEATSGSVEYVVGATATLTENVHDIIPGVGLISFQGRTDSAAILENSDVTSVVVQSQDIAVVESNIAIVTPGTPQKVNFSNIDGFGGFYVDGGNDLVLNPGYAGLYEITFYAATEGFASVGGFSASTFEAWAIQNSDVLNGSYLISGTPVQDITLTSSKSFIVYLNDSDVLSFYINSTTSNLRLNYAAASAPRPNIYPIQVVLKKISL